MDEHTLSDARGKVHPLERAWAMLRVARTTSSEVEFIDALQGAMDAADKCWASEAALVREQVADIQRTRGPSLVPSQLGGGTVRWRR